MGYAFPAGAAFFQNAHRAMQSLDDESPATTWYGFQPQSKSPKAKGEHYAQLANEFSCDRRTDLLTEWEAYPNAVTSIYDGC